MAETIRLNKVLRELNISLDRAVEYLDSKGVEIEKRPTTKISEEVHQLLYDEFETDANKKAKSQKVSEEKPKEKEALREERERELEEKQKKDDTKQSEVVKAKSTLTGPKQVGKIDLEPKKKKVEEPKVEPESKTKDEPKVSKETKTENGIEVSYIENETNDLFELNIIFDMGRDNDKKLGLAVGYLEYLGTDKFSAEQLKKEF